MPRLLTPPVRGPLLLRRLPLAAAVVAGSDFRKRGRAAAAAFGGSGAGRAGGGGAAVRDPHAAGNVDAKDLPDGENAPNNVDGNFVLGPTHPAAPDTVENADVSKGAVCIFAMESGDSRMYPGITRAPRDPNAPPQPPNSRMIPVMPAPYSRRVYVLYSRGSMSREPGLLRSLWARMVPTTGCSLRSIT